MLLALTSFVVVNPTAHANGPVPPSDDPFYTYDGAAPLDEIPPGTVLDHRSIQLAFGPGNSTPIRAEQLLYRTTDQLGEPSVTVSTVLVPITGLVRPAIVGYLSFYDGLGSRCSPSHTIAGGDPGGQSSQQQAQEEALLVTWHLEHGTIVTIPDFEGTGLHWMAGRESGRSTLDAIRATESFLEIDPDAPVGLSGYSGGSVAANWANELAPGYAPELNLVGVAEAGIPVDYVHHLAYIDGTDVYSAAIPGELLGLSRAYGIDLTPYLSAYGRDVVDQERDACIADMFGRFPGLTIKQIMDADHQDLATVEPIATILRDQTMGALDTTPKAPVLMAMGNTDGTGDGAMVAADVQALAAKYCDRGVTVLYQEYQGADHISAAALFEPQVGPWLEALLNGAPAVGNCAALGLPQLAARRPGPPPHPGA